MKEIADVQKKTTAETIGQKKREPSAIGLQMALSLWPVVRAFVVSCLCFLQQVSAKAGCCAVLRYGVT